MKTKLSFLLIAICAVTLFFVRYKDVFYGIYGVENGELYCYTKGEKYTVDLKYFALNSIPDGFLYDDSMSLYEVIKTTSRGFKSERQELLETEKLGNFEVRTYHFKGYFIVDVESSSHKTDKRYLPFDYEAKELWLNNKMVVSHPMSFENVGMEVTEFQLSGEDDCESVDSRYMILFKMEVLYGYDGYDSETVSNFEYFYFVNRYDESFSFKLDECMTLACNGISD